MAKRCLIIAGGCLKPSPEYHKLTAAAEFIICADGGFKHAKALGVTPNIVAGDFDSLNKQEINELEKAGIMMIRYPQEKDYTDTHIALLEAINRGFAEITIIAALGGRLDHTFANLMLLGLPEIKNANITIVDENEEIFLIRESKLLYGYAGQTISLFPLTQYVRGINTKGLKYPLRQGELIMGIPIGVSNEFVEDIAEIEIAEGLLLAIKNKKRP